MGAANARPHRIQLRMGEHHLVCEPGCAIAFPAEGRPSAQHARARRRAPVCANQPQHLLTCARAAQGVSSRNTTARRSKTLPWREGAPSVLPRLGTIGAVSSRPAAASRQARGRFDIVGHATMQAEEGGTGVMGNAFDVSSFIPKNETVTKRTTWRRSSQSEEPDSVFSLRTCRSLVQLLGKSGRALQCHLGKE